MTKWDCAAASAIACGPSAPRRARASSSRSTSPRRPSGSGRGLESLRRAGLSPIGFVPPAWLAREDTFRAARRAGLAMSEDAHGIRLHARATRLVSPVIRWSGRTAWRAHLSAAVADARWMTARGSWLARLALHPADLRHAATAESITAHLDRWRRLRHQHRYALL